MFPFRKNDSQPSSQRNQTQASARRASRNLRLRVESLEQREMLTINPVSVVSLGGVQQDSGSRVAFDAQNNLYLYGDFSATVDFDQTNSYSDNRDILTSHGSIDMFVAKYLADGSFAWVRGFGNSSVDQTIDGTEGLAVDASGNIYAAVLFYGTVDYDGHTLTQLAGADGGSNALVRLNPQGAS